MRTRVYTQVNVRHERNYYSDILYYIMIHIHAVCMCVYKRKRSNYICTRKIVFRYESNENQNGTRWKLFRD